MSRHLLRVSLGTAACMFLAACGSTVAQQGGALGAPAGNQPGAVAPGTGLGDGASTASGGSTGSTGTSGGGSVPVGTGGSTTGGGTAGGSSSTSGGATGASTGVAGSTGATGGSGTSGGSATAVGPGVTATEIRLGIPYCNDCSGGNAAAGAAGEDPGDTRRYYKAALDEVNSRGGVLGRKLVPVFHEVSVSDNIEASQQAACETFTKDNKVFMIFFRGDIIYECAKRAGIAVWGSGVSGQVFERYPNLFTPSSIRFERLAAVTVNAAAKANWQKPDTKYPTGKIGLISWDSPEYRYAVDKGWSPALKANGLTLAAPIRYIAIPQNASSLTDSSSAISSAVLAFRDAGIDHVLISDGPAGIFTGAGLTFQFLQNAKSQRYYPRYFFNSNNAPDFSSHPQDELVGMLAVDDGDTKPSNDEGIAPNPQRERCYALMRKAGLPVGQDQTQALASAACEFAWWTEALVKHARSTLLPDVIAGGEAVGTAYRSPYNFGNKIVRGQHDGVSLFRNLRYDEGCSCIKYTSKPYEP